MRRYLRRPAVFSVTTYRLPGSCVADLCRVLAAQPSSVLIASSSDVPFQQARCVTLSQLPFRWPTSADSEQPPGGDADLLVEFGWFLFRRRRQALFARACLYFASLPCWGGVLARARCGACSVPGAGLHRSGTSPAGAGACGGGGRRIVVPADARPPPELSVARRGSQPHWEYTLSALSSLRRPMIGSPGSPSWFYAAVRSAPPTLSGPRCCTRRRRPLSCWYLHGGPGGGRRKPGRLGRLCALARSRRGRCRTIWCASGTVRPAGS